MRHRHWLLIVGAAALFYAFVLVRVNWFINLLPTYGSSDITMGVLLAIACLAAWAALEVTHARTQGHGLACRCGYSLRGMKCPECGQPLGTDEATKPTRTPLSFRR